MDGLARGKRIGRLFDRELQVRVLRAALIWSLVAITLALSYVILFVLT